MLTDVKGSTEGKNSSPERTQREPAVLGNAVEPAVVIGRDVTLIAVLWSWRRLWVRKDLQHSKVRSSFLQQLLIPILITWDLTEFGGNGARGASFRFLVLTFGKKQMVGRARAPCTAGFSTCEDKSDPQLAYDITGCLEEVINPVCNTREISDYGKNKGSSSVNCRHSGKIGKKKGYHKYKTTQDKLV